MIDDSIGMDIGDPNSPWLRVPYEKDFSGSFSSSAVAVIPPPYTLCGCPPRFLNKSRQLLHHSLTQCQSRSRMREAAIPLHLFLAPVVFSYQSLGRLRAVSPRRCAR